MESFAARAIATCALVLGCSALACSSTVNNIGQQFDAGAGTGGAAGQASTGGSGGQTSTGGRSTGGAAGTATGGSAGGADAPCDPSEQPVADAVFVSTTGSDSNNGTAAFPVQSLPVAIAKAKAALASRIYLHVGDYSLPQTLEFTAAEGGIVIEGGWQKSGSTWTPDCEANRRSFTTLSVASAVAVRVTDVTRAAGFQHLTLTTAAQGSTTADQPGESMVGVWLSGTGTAFNLTDVELFSGDAGAGGAITTTPARTGTSSCDGHAGCCTTGTGCGDNVTGPAVPPQSAAGGAATKSGTFSASGYVVANGSDGTTGTNGSHGKTGAAGQNLGNVCRVGGSCGSCVNCSSGSGTCQGGTPPSGYSALVGETGRCGCSGLGGQGGLGGRGGGASVAVLVGDGATVSVKYSALHAGKGGDGHAGGSAGPGGSGAAGQPGATSSCRTSCYSTCFGTCGCDISSSATGGGAGTRGGDGGKGGDGGGGSGGPSYGVVTVGTGAFTDAGSNAVTFSAGGNGANGAIAGPSGATLKQ